ncbi:MAG: hypothetical protein AMJ43_02390 [Coxiella sp. DG_40]|nr:MAG: hypothetical protein AMJ43_02390 [Coxiella sp. DG_40]
MFVLPEENDFETEEEIFENEELENKETDSKRQKTDRTPNLTPPNPQDLTRGQVLPPISAYGRVLPPISKISTYSTFCNFAPNAHLPYQYTESIPLEQFLNIYKTSHNLSKFKYPTRYTNRLLSDTNQMGLRQFLFLVLLFELNFKQCQQTISELLGYTVTSESSKSTRTCKIWIKDAYQAFKSLKQPITLHKLFVNYSCLITYFSPQQPQFFQQQSHSRASSEVKILLRKFGFEDDFFNPDLVKMIYTWGKELESYPEFWSREKNLTKYIKLPYSCGTDIIVEQPIISSSMPSYIP